MNRLMLTDAIPASLLKSSQPRYLACDDGTLIVTGGDQIIQLRPDDIDRLRAFIDQHTTEVGHAHAQ